MTRQQARGRNGKWRGEFLRKYQQMVDEQDVLVNDIEFSDTVGCAPNTPQRIRSRLTEHGYEFTRVDSGKSNLFDTFIVSARPQPEPQPQQKAANAANTLYRQEIDAIRQEFAHQNIVIGELSQMVAELVQIGREMLDIWRS